MPDRRLIILGLIAGVQGVALVVYAIFDVVGWARFGLSGPAAVSNVPGIVLQIVIFAACGSGLLAVAWAWFHARRWARAPFITMQAIGLVVGWPLASANGSVERAAGIALVVMAIIGVGIALSPRITRILQAGS